MEVVSSDSKASIADATYALRDPCLAKEVVLHHTTNWLRPEENSIVVGLTECMYIVRGVSSEHRPCAEYRMTKEQCLNCTRGLSQLRRSVPTAALTADAAYLFVVEVC